MAYRHLYENDATISSGDRTVSVRIHVKTPESEEGKVVIPYANLEKKFDLKNYDPRQTDNKLSSEEVETIMKEIADPFVKWQIKFGYLMGENKTLNRTLCILFPLFIIYIFAWGICAQSYAFFQHRKVIKEAEEIVRKHNTKLQERGLSLYMPQKFPQWIEIRVSAPKFVAMMPPQQQYYPMLQQQQPQYYAQPGMVQQPTYYSQVPMQQTPVMNA